MPASGIAARLTRSEHDRGEPSWRKVLEAAQTGEEATLAVEVSAMDGRVETCRATELHPFWVVTRGEGGFVAAGDHVGVNLSLPGHALEGFVIIC